MKKIFLLFFLISIVIIVKAQSSFCPPNIDFEQGNLNHWICNVGSCATNTVNTSMPPILTYPGTPTGPNSVQHVIRTSGTDYYGGFPVVNPITGNTYSLQLGDTLETALNVCARAVYAVHVPANANNFSLQYYYAIVLENSTYHTANEQPYFHAQVFDSANNSVIIQCASYTFVQPQSGALPGFTASIHLDKNNGDTIYYKSWTPSTISLNGLAGHTVYIQFDASDCTGGAHSGYAYIDFATACQLPVIVQGYCPGSPTAGLYGPNGFQTYKWYDSTRTTLLSTTQTYTINPAPTDTTKYILVVLPYQGFGCPDTMTTYLTAQPKPISNFGYPDHYCAGSIIHFRDSSISLTPGTYINHWKWDFGDPSAGVGNPNTDTTQNPSHVYNNLGTYTACLVVESSISCESDTQCYQIHIDRLQPPLPILFTKNNICGTTDTTTIWTSVASIPNATYTWTISGGTLVSGSLSSISTPLVVKWNSSGSKLISLTAAPPIGDDTDCWVHNQITINVKGIYPSVFLTGNDSICLNQNTTVTTSGRPSTCGASSIVCSNPLTYSVGSNNAGSTSIPTPFYGLWTQSKFQMIVLASELTSLGFQGGPISEIAWNVISKNSSQGTQTGCNGNGQYAGFTINMACVPYNSIFHGTGSDSLDVTTPLTTVYTTTAYNTTSGINNFVLQTPYNWDGVSNLLIQTCYNAGSVCYTSNDYVASSTVASIAAANGVPASVNLAAYAYSDQSIGCDPNYPYSSSNGTSGFLGYYTANRPDVILKACSGNIPNTTTFSWTSTPAGYNSAQTNITVSPTVTTTYHLVANDNGCITPDSFKVTVLTVNTVNAGLDTTICPGKHIVLHASATGPPPTTPVPCSTNTTGGCSGATLTAQVGTGTNTSNAYSPFNYNYGNSRVAMRYSAASLQAALGAGPKIINQLQFNVTNHQNTYPYPGFTVKISCVNPNAVYWGASSNTFPTNGYVVYTTPNYTMSAGNGWKTIPFTSSYNWDGQSDLIVEVCYSSTLFSSIDVVQQTTTANNCVLYAGNGTTPAGCNITTGTTSTLLPNIKLGYCNYPIIVGGYNFHWTAIPSSPNPFISTADTATPIVAPFVTTKFYVTLLGTTSCPVSDTVIVNAGASYSSVHSKNDTVCVGTKVKLTSNSSSALHQIVAWQWTSLHGNPIACSTCDTATVTVNGKDTILVIISDALGCSKLDTIALDTFRTPIASFILDKYTECSGLKVIATSTSTTNSFGGAVTYTWNFNNPNYFGANSTNSIDTASWINTSTTPLVKTITLKVTQDGCTSPTFGSQDTIHMIPIALITASLNEVCSGITLSESSVGSSAENLATASYAWSSNPVATTPPVLTGAGPNSFAINLPTDSTTLVWVYLQITQNGCVSNLDSTALTVHGIPNARFRATPNPSCSGDTVTFIFTGKLDSLSNLSHKLDWTFNNGTPANYSSTTTDKAISIFSNNGTAISTSGVSLSVTQNGICKSAPYNADVLVNPNPVPVIVGPRDICANQVAQLSTQVPYKNYVWKNNYGETAITSTFSAGKDESITLNVIDYNNCAGSGSLQVTVHPIPTANAGEDQTIFLGNSAHLDGSSSFGGETFLWTPGGTLNDASSMLPIATPPTTTSYVLVYTNSLGCADYDTVVVHVKDCKPLLVPNAFTPFNNDGIDDYFMILNPDDFYRLVRMEIYNRWGQLIFSTNDKNSKGWDGKYQGTEQQIDTYIYNIIAECGGGKIIQLKGDVTLLR